MKGQSVTHQIFVELTPQSESHYTQVGFTYESSSSTLKSRDFTLPTFSLINRVTETLVGP